MTNVVLVSLLIGVFIGLVIFLFLSRLFFSRSSSAQSDIPRFSAKEAERLLQKNGYQVLNRRQKATVMTNVDGKDHLGYVEVDFIVKKNGKKYVAIVPLAEGETDPNEPIFRRKLMEIDRAFGFNGVITLNLGSGQVQRVSFRFPHEKNIDFYFRFLIGLFLVLGIIGIIWLLAMLKLI
ncbi:MAG: hypothetical protein KKA31_03115 [Candidatus Margulisbacteria bacterium]|nr:hypothetical protein [Candidatus Margulisiibacteriota bacterium]